MKFPVTLVTGGVCVQSIYIVAVCKSQYQSGILGLRSLALDPSWVGGCPARIKADVKINVRFGSYATATVNLS